MTIIKHGFQFSFLSVPLDILIAIFYWMLLNIHPAHRSTLKSIQLLTVVKATHLKKYGIDAVLEPSIRDLKTLGTTVSFITTYLMCVCVCLCMCVSYDAYTHSFFNLVC